MTTLDKLLRAGILLALIAAIVGLTTLLSGKLHQEQSPDPAIITIMFIAIVALSSALALGARDFFRGGVE